MEGSLSSASSPPAPGTGLVAALDRLASRHVPGTELGALREELRRRYGPALRGILFYGSCLRSGNALDGLVDLYVVVDRYRSAYRNPLTALANALLPPNVFYLEVPVPAGRVRCKYAVFSMRHLLRGTSARWFQSYLWGRLAQPTAVLYAADERARGELLQTLGQAVVTLLWRALPALPERFTEADLWERALALSYATELRAEKSQRSALIVESDPEYYREVTAPALGVLAWPVRSVAGEEGSMREASIPLREGNIPLHEASIPPRTRRRSRLAWSARRVQGKTLSVLRLAKSAFTFQGGVDYLLWKLERHSGVRVEASERERRHPLIYGWGLAWRLYRRGAFR